MLYIYNQKSISPEYVTRLINGAHKVFVNGNIHHADEAIPYISFFNLRIERSDHPLHEGIYTLFIGTEGFVDPRVKEEEKRQKMITHYAQLLGK